MGEFRGKNIPYLQQDHARRSPSPDRPRAGGCGARHRDGTAAAVRRRGPTRPRPHLDDKVLAAWNGMMIAALARASQVLDGESAERSPDTAAVRAAAFVRDHRSVERQARCARCAAGMRVRRRTSQASIDGYAEDYACVIWGLLELVQATGDAAWLDWALELQKRQDDLFRDDANGGWFATTGEDSSVLLRVKEEYDGAEAVRRIGRGGQPGDAGAPYGRRQRGHARGRRARDASAGASGSRPGRRR